MDCSVCVCVVYLIHVELTRAQKWVEDHEKHDRHVMTKWKKNNEKLCQMRNLKLENGWSDFCTFGVKPIENLRQPSCVPCVHASVRAYNDMHCHS